MNGNVNHKVGSIILAKWSRVPSQNATGRYSFQSKLQRNINLRPTISYQLNSACSLYGLAVRQKAEHILASQTPCFRRIRHQICPDLSSILIHGKWCGKAPANRPSLNMRQAASTLALRNGIWRHSCPLSSDRVKAMWQRSQSSSPKNEHDESAHDSIKSKEQGTQNTGGALDFPGITPTSTPNKHIMDRLPRITHIHRPTKEELLSAATGFWSRLKVRFKWFSIRSGRPFNVDEIGAFFSWVLLGHVLWIILGTTTFFSLAIFAVNTVFAQGITARHYSLKLADEDLETLARWVGNYLTKSSGIKIVFESAIVPRWGDGVITFKNVFVSRRPGQGTGRVSKGSSSTAAAAAAAADRVRGSEDAMAGAALEEEDTNFTQFDLSIDTVNVTLSFAKWFNSKGLLRDVEVKGVRGVIDRTSVHQTGQYVDPRSYKHEHNPGDFEINSFKMEDLLVTVHQPRKFRPFSVSIFACDLPQLRRQWLFYDFLSANVMSGSFDDSLFTIHPRQVHGHFGLPGQNGVETSNEASPWKKHSRIRIDGLNIDHLNRDVEGPFSWIHEGNVDIIADIMFPADNDESIAKVMSDFYDRMEATVTSNGNPHADTGTKPLSVSDASHKQGVMPPFTSKVSDHDKRFLVMDLRVHLNDVRAAVPLFTKDLSYVNNALIRPIVAYINSRKTFIPIHCRVVKNASEFDGSWTIFDSGLMDDLSAEVMHTIHEHIMLHLTHLQTYKAFAKDVTDDQARLRRFRKVGLWSLQLAIQALFTGMAGSIA